jgi:hypothetical protein
MTDNVTQFYDKDAGVVDFGVKRVGYTAVVDGREIPKMMVMERGNEITIQLDGRFGIDVPRILSERVCWMIANALAIGEGYAFLGSPNKDRPFAPEVIAVYGPIGGAE